MKSDSRSAGSFSRTREKAGDEGLLPARRARPSPQPSPASGRGSKRRLLVAALAATTLSACGFQLRQAPDFAFDNLYVQAAPNSSLAAELRRNIAASGKVVVAPTPQAQVVLEVLDERREKVVVGLNANGQVREFQLRTRLRFRLGTPAGKELIPPTELLQQRDISFNESAVLSKESEENLLYREMQADLVQQLMRRLAAVRGI